MKVERVPLDRLTLDPRNARLHDERSVEAIRRSLERFGQQKPVVAKPDGVIVAGNGMVTAARALGWKDIAVAWTDLEGDAVLAFAVADNRTAELSDWHFENLATVLEEIPDFHDALGFSDGDLSNLLSAEFDPSQIEGGAGVEDHTRDEESEEEADGSDESEGGMIYLNGPQLGAVNLALTIARRDDPKLTIGAFLGRLSIDYTAAQEAE